MDNGITPVVVAVFVIGIVILLSGLCRAGLERLGLPGLIGYILIGLFLGYADDWLGFLSRVTGEGLEVLAATGIVILLFRVGLESNPKKLWKQLPTASLALLGSILPSGILGYLAVRYGFGAGVVPALFVGTAFMATSVGVSLSVWRDLHMIGSDDGALLLDVAELDDIVSIFFMAILLSMAPLLHSNGILVVNGALLGEAGWLVCKLFLLAVVCFLFARFVERRLTAWLARIEASPVPIVPVVAIGLVVAALAGWLGFSLAVGALFAGLAFSRDPRRVKLDKAFETLSQFFVPFFFVGIGLKVDTSLMLPALGIGSILFVIAVAAKVGGTAIPILYTSGGASALLIGVSMVPRAEVAMIVAERGYSLGDWAMSPELYGGIVFVTLGTCLVTPPLVRYLLLSRRRSRG